MGQRWRKNCQPHYNEATGHNETARLPPAEKRLSAFHMHKAAGEQTAKTIIFLISLQTGLKEDARWAHTTVELRYLLTIDSKLTHITVCRIACIAAYK